MKRSDRPTMAEHGELLREGMQPEHFEMWQAAHDRLRDSERKP
jgi:hypothetical protein